MKWEDNALRGVDRDVGQKTVQEKVARPSGDEDFLVVADAAVGRRSDRIDLHLDVDGARDYLFRREFCKLCPGELRDQHTPKHKDVWVRLPFAIAERLEHVDEVVLLLDAQLAAWEVACELFRLGKRIFEIVCLRGSKSMPRSKVCLCVHTAWRSLCFDSGVDIPAGCWVSSRTVTSFGRSSS